jgi:hypothetical protein
MTDRMTVSWRGRDYEAVRRDGPDARPEPGPVWQVTHQGAVVTSFPAREGEPSREVREKIVEWLEANQSRPSLDVGRQ